MKCNNCGNEVTDSSSFCRECGTKLSTPVSLTNNNRTTSNNIDNKQLWVIGGVVLLVVVCIVVVGVLLVSNIANENMSVINDTTNDSSVNDTVNASLSDSSSSSSKQSVSSNSHQSNSNGREIDHITYEYNYQDDDGSYLTNIWYTDGEFEQHSDNGRYNYKSWQ